MSAMVGFGISFAFRHNDAMGGGDQMFGLRARDDPPPH